MASIVPALSVGNTSIRQHNGLYSLNDLHRASGNLPKHKPSEWLRNQQTQDLLAEIEKAGIPAITSKPKVGTYACKELVIAYAAWISAAFHLKVIRVFLAANEPKQPELFHASQYETLNQLVRRLARQLAEPNGYCVATFMPLYEVICEKLGHKARYIERLPELLIDPGFEVSDELLSQLQLATHQRLMQKLRDAREGVDVLETAIRRIKGKPAMRALPA